MKMRLEYLAIPLSAILVTAIIDALFPGILHRIFRIALNTISAAIAAMFIFTDTVFMSYSIDFIYPIYMAAILYFAVSFAIKLRKINLPQGIFLFGLGFFIYTTLREFLWRQDIILLPPFEGGGMMRMGESVAIATMLSVLVFSFCMAAAVFISASDELERAKQDRIKATAESDSLQKYSRIQQKHVATIAHETMTPLTVLSQYAEYAGGEIRDLRLPKSEELAEYLDFISDEAHRIAGIIDLLGKNAIKSFTDASKQKLDLLPILEDAVRLYAPVLAKTGTSTVLDAAANLPQVYANQHQIKQVLLNLLHNAKKHTSNGKIVIKAALLDCEDAFIEISVSDTGTGIPQELIPALMKKSGQMVESERDRLGLSICRGIIDDHGGSMLIESQEGEGTKVSFTLPICTAKKCGGEAGFPAGKTTEWRDVDGQS